MITKNEYDALNFDKASKAEYEAIIEWMNHAEFEIWDIRRDISVEDSDEDEK